MEHIKKFDILLADLNPRFGTEPGKVRPVVVVQTDLLNDIHPSVIICPLTTQILHDAKLLRIPVEEFSKRSDIIVDQIRAIDRKRLIKKVGRLTLKEQNKLMNSLKILILE